MYVFACSIVCGGTFMCVHICVPRHVYSFDVPLHLIYGSRLSCIYVLCLCLLSTGIINRQPFLGGIYMGSGGQKSCPHSLKGTGVIYFTSSVSVLSFCPTSICFRHLWYPAEDQILWAKGWRIYTCFEPLLTFRHHIYEGGARKDPESSSVGSSAELQGMYDLCETWCKI